MTAINDLYELKHKFRDFDNKLMENVYFYRQENENPGGAHQSQALADAWQTEVLTPSLPTYGVAFVTYEIKVRNLFDLADQHTKSINVPGTRSTVGTDYMPSFISAVVTAATDNGLVRKGRKMLAGMLELDQATGLLNGTGLAAFAIRAVLYGAYLFSLLGGAKKWAPVVVKRVRVGSVPPYTYRLPETQGEAVFGYITSAVTSTIVSAQDTRKR